MFRIERMKYFGALVSAFPVLEFVFDILKSII